MISSSVAEALERMQSQRLPYPSWINIENTLRCNLRCPMCQTLQMGNTHSNIDMDLDFFRKISEELFPHVQTVRWSVSGEPLMAPHFEQFLDIANQYPIRTEITTNATLLHRRGILDKLLPSLSCLGASLDASTPETYEKLRVGSNWTLVIRNLREFQRARISLPAARRPQFYLNYVLRAQNIHELPLFVDLASELGADLVNASKMVVFNDEMSDESLFHHKSRANRFFDAALKRGEQLGVAVSLPPHFRDVDPKDEEYGPIAPQLLDLPQDLSFPSGKQWRQKMQSMIEQVPPYTSISRLLDARCRKNLIRTLRRRLQIRQWKAATGIEDKCYFLWDRAYISVTGDVVPCCVPGRPVVGSLASKSFMEIWNGAVLNEMRAGLSLGVPHQCCVDCHIIRGSTDPDDEGLWRKVS